MAEIKKEFDLGDIKIYTYKDLSFDLYNENENDKMFGMLSINYDGKGVRINFHLESRSQPPESLSYEIELHGKNFSFTKGVPKKGGERGWCPGALGNINFCGYASPTQWQENQYNRLEYFAIVPMNPGDNLDSAEEYAIQLTINYTKPKLVLDQFGVGSFRNE